MGGWVVGRKGMDGFGGWIWFWTVWKCMLGYATHPQAFWCPTGGSEACVRLQPGHPLHAWHSANPNSLTLHSVPIPPSSACRCCGHTTATWETPGPPTWGSAAGSSTLGSSCARHTALARRVLLIVPRVCTHACACRDGWVQVHLATFRGTIKRRGDRGHRWVAPPIIPHCRWLTLASPPTPATWRPRRSGTRLSSSGQSENPCPGHTVRAPPLERPSQTDT